MTIDFILTDLPTSNQKSIMIAYIEGTVTIFVNNQIFFNQPGILLVEFARFIRSWLDKALQGDDLPLIYETMDYDEPILSLIPEDAGNYRIRSIWQERPVETFLTREELINEFEKYLLKLSVVLESKHIILKEIL